MISVEIIKSATELSTIDYNALGGIIEDDCYRYERDAFNRIVQVQNKSAQVWHRVQYVYDAMGRSVKRTVLGLNDEVLREERLTYAGLQLIENGDDEIIYGSDINRPLALRKASSGLVYQTILDERGSVMALVQNGTMKMRYSVWGQRQVEDLDTSDDLVNAPFGFTGMAVEKVLSMVVSANEAGFIDRPYYHCHYRDYDSFTGQFDQPDQAGMPDGMNRYVAYFVLGGGGRGTDIDGLSAKTQMVPVFDENYNVIRYEPEWKSRMPNVQSVSEAMANTNVWDQPLSLMDPNAPVFTGRHAAKAVAVTGAAYMGGFALGEVAPFIVVGLSNGMSSAVTAYSSVSASINSALIYGGGTVYIHGNRIASTLADKGRAISNYIFQKPEIFRMPSNLTFAQAREWLRINQNLSEKNLRVFSRQYDPNTGFALFGNSKFESFIQSTSNQGSMLYNNLQVTLMNPYVQKGIEQFQNGILHPAIGEKKDWWDIWFLLYQARNDGTIAPSDLFQFPFNVTDKILNPYWNFENYIDEVTKNGK